MGDIATVTIVFVAAVAAGILPVVVVLFVFVVSAADMIAALPQLLLMLFCRHFFDV